MGLKDRLAESRDRSRQEREAFAARNRRMAKADELQNMGIVDGVTPSLSEAVLDAMIDAENQRRSELYAAFYRAETVTTFRALAVQVPAGGDVVYTIGTHDHLAKRNSSRPLGPLAGAVAQVTDGTSAFSLGKAAMMPIALAPLARKETADALIIFTDSTVHKVALDGSQALRAARAQCVEFNVLAAASAPSVPSTGGDDPAARLRKLQGLLDAGLVSQDEYDARRIAIIESI